MNKRRLAALLALATVAIVLCILLVSNPSLFSRMPIAGNGANPNNNNDNQPQDSTLSEELWINEIMTGNNKSVPDEAGEFDSWIEIYNPGESSVNLAGYALSDDVSKGPRWVFPSMQIAPKAYLVVFASGKNIANADAPYLHANFSFKAGEQAIIFSPSGGFVDELTLPAVTKEHSIGRSVADPQEYEEYGLPTPGFANDDAGRAAYEAAMTAPESGLYISEIMSSNQTTLADEDGEYSDWIELYNSTDAPIALEGYGLSDDANERLQWRFPAVSIEPRSYLLIFASGKADPLGKRTELHATFKLSSLAETVTLCDGAGKLIDQIAYEEIPADHSLGRVPETPDSWAVSPKPTPGFPNDDAGYDAFSAKYAFAPGPLRISEIMLSNSSHVQAEDKQYYDWIELFNASDTPIALQDYALSDNPKNPRKWRFPDATIAAGEYLVVLASGNNVTDTKKKYLETGFALNTGGEILTLADANGELLDRIAIPRLPGELSYGRTGNALRYYDTPTPAQPNDEGYAGIARDPVFSLKPGIYDGAIEVSLSARADETIYYSLDCTTPTQDSLRYSGPIRIDKNTVVRAVAVGEGRLASPTASGTYLLRSDDVNHQLPIVTLVTDPKNLWDNKTGIYAYGETFDPEEAFPRTSGNYYRGKGSEAEQAKWEREADFAVFDESGTQAFGQTVDIRIAGSYGRGNAQKGINLLARKKYGSSRMEYAFFDTRDFEEYKGLVLRAGGQDQKMSKLRDELSTSLLEGTDVHLLYQANKPYVLYLNGEYWGVYFLKEKRNRFFVAQHENLSDDTALNLIKSTDQVSYGSSKEWKTLMEYVSSHDLSRQDAYDHVAAEVDLESFMDYMICEIYVANSDVWNIQYYKTEGGKWRWIYYDFCWSWGNTEGKADHKTLSIRRLNTKPCSDLFNGLLKNAQWREAFIQRFAHLLKTVYAPERVNAQIDTLVNALQPELQREREKFNAATFMGVKQAPETVTSSDVERWLGGQVKTVRDFANERPEKIKAQIQREFDLSDSYMRDVFGS